MDNVIEETKSLIKKVQSFVNTTPWRGYYSSQLEFMNERAEQPCELAIVGQVKAGKSSFLNALLGSDLAMVGETEMTATINFFKYGKPKDEDHPVRVIWEDGTEEWQTKQFLDSLQGNTKEVLDRASKIDHLEYFLENDILHNVTLVDTPGTGSLVNDHEERTNDYITQGKEKLRAKHNEQSVKLKNRADAVIVITGRVEQNATNVLISNFSQETSAFNALGVMTKIDLEPSTTSDDWNRRCAKYTEMLRQQLNTIIPVSANVYQTTRKLKDLDRLSTIKDALKFIPDEEFEEVCSSRDIFLGNDSDINAYFNNYCLSYQQRKALTEGIDVWMTFYTVARALHFHTLEDAQNILISYSGMERMKEIIEKQFLNRSRIIRCAKIVRELHSILDEIKYRHIPNMHKDVLYRDVYIDIIESSQLKNKEILESFKDFVQMNICTQQQTDDFKNNIEKLSKEIESVASGFMGTDKKTEALILLEKKQKSFTEKEITELETLFGKHVGETIVVDRPTVARRQAYWRSRRNKSTSDEVNKIIDLAIFAYGTLKSE